MSIKKIIVNSIWFGIIPKITILINILALPFITPYLTPEDYGLWGIISSYLSIFTSISALGLNVHLTNSYYEYKNKFYLIWQRILYLLILSAVLASILFIILLLIVLTDIPMPLRLTIVLLASFSVLFSSNSVIANHLYVLYNKPKPLVLRQLLSSLIGLGVLFVAIYYFRWGYIGFVLNIAVTSIISFFLFIKPLWLSEKVYPKVENSIKRVKYLFKIALPIIPHTLGLMLLSSSSRIVMTLYDIPIDQIGLFTNGYMIGDYITIISVAIVTALTPQIQEAYRTQNYKTYRNLFYLMQCVSLMAIVLFSTWMPEIYRLLIRNDQLQEAYPIASMICYANALYPFYVFTSTITFIQKETTKTLYLAFVPGLFNILLCLILIPFWGYKVAVYSTIISYWSQLILPFCNNYFNHITVQWLGKLWKLFVLLLVLISFIILTNTMSLLPFGVKIVLSIILMLLIFIYMKKRGLFYL